MSDFKSVKQLCEEHSNLDIHIHKLDKTITDLEKENQSLVKRHIELENSLIELRKYHKEFEQFAATVYDPKKSTYKELEQKVAQAETKRQKDIDELWETRISPMQQKIEEYEKSLILTQTMRADDDIRIRKLETTIKDQQTIINYAVGYISACEQFRDKHPTDVQKWLFKGLK